MQRRISRILNIKKHSSGGALIDKISSYYRKKSHYEKTLAFAFALVLLLTSLASCSTMNKIGNRSDKKEVVDIPEETEYSLPSYNKCVDPATHVTPFFQYVNTPNDILHLRTGPQFLLWLNSFSRILYSEQFPIC